jgi:hypothetical protein
MPLYMVAASLSQTVRKQRTAQGEGLAHSLALTQMLLLHQHDCITSISCADSEQACIIAAIFAQRAGKQHMHRNTVEHAFSLETRFCLRIAYGAPHWSYFAC